MIVRFIYKLRFYTQDKTCLQEFNEAEQFIILKWCLGVLGCFIG